MIRETWDSSSLKLIVQYGCMIVVTITYEYLCAWVDDILFASKNPMWLMEELKNKYKYVLKGVGSPTYYLGSDIKRVDKDVHDKGVLTMGSTT